MTITLAIFYAVVLFLQIPVMIKILILFKTAYEDLYKVVKCKIIWFLIVYEIFLIFRVENYVHM